jgi:hypothetical protein
VTSKSTAARKSSGGRADSLRLARRTIRTAGALPCWLTPFKRNTALVPFDTSAAAQPEAQRRLDGEGRLLTACRMSQTIRELALARIKSLQTAVNFGLGTLVATGPLSVSDIATYLTYLKPI